ncbi:sporulation protein YlmC with PRC-barrel domain [Deinobacterium chartae]|uniref:Sporulation protein YlmC with PRC-barrel domain n=1 Tax=Deinobacterium chartae TaxID=521158 RepID=A0A841I107_9DEIO|nr:PRC-barrel domain-containing protein [Deinobacterium chartae]MBB6098664.1 sporulation protein YlmC with PRC-barrel domain [Deinobacterium chartae]
MRATELIGQAVHSPQETRLGQVDNVVFDFEQGTLLALQVSADPAGMARVVSFEATYELNPGGPVRVSADDLLPPARLPRVRAALDARAVVGAALTDAQGTVVLGHLSDALFDAQTGRVESYILIPPSAACTRSVVLPQRCVRWRWWGGEVRTEYSVLVRDLLRSRAEVPAWP